MIEYAALNMPLPESIREEVVRRMAAKKSSVTKPGKRSLDIEPCAKCGANAAIRRSEKNGYVFYQLRCVKCGAQGRSYALEPEHENLTKGFAIKNWNETQKAKRSIRK